MEQVGISISELESKLPNLTDEEWSSREQEAAAKEGRAAALELAAKDKKKRIALDSLGFPDVPVEDFEAIMSSREMVSWGVPVEIARMPILSNVYAAYAKVQEFEGQMAAGKRLLVLEGGNGLGKSTAAAWWLAREGPRLLYLDAQEQPIHPPKFITSSDFELMGKFSAKAINRVYWARRLVLDDLGVEGKYPDLVTRLVALLGHRMVNELPTVITSNMPGEEWREMFSGRHYQRLGVRLHRRARWAKCPELDSKT